ncbi:MAG: DEAD/DEAH box helicase, partial [Anaerolineae bacterium]|nr:DEAD/DEAH box helicase [Anaerolineae bacterium]
SATHRNPYNVVYRLTPFDAYRQGLVKRIEVFSARQEQDERAPYLRLIDIRSQKQTITARVAVHALLKSGQIKEQTLTVRPGDDLQDSTNRLEYRGYVVEEINPGYGSIRFANNVEIAVGQELGPNQEAIFEAQIRYAVESHFRKQRHVRPAGVKVLTLFFIDRVDNYAAEDGLIRVLFNRAFDDLKRRYPDWQDRDAAQVQAAYFAQRRTRAGEVIYEDSKTGEADRDREAYDLIMRDKERLLSFDEPVAFVFSHSALREGWDNPNVCQICTLNQTVSEVKKRQEVGRGVRLVVDQSGQRLHDERYNILTVVANESYERFVAQLQSEIAFEYQAEIEARYGKSFKDLSAAERQAVEAEYGQGILPPPPANARQRGAARLNKACELDPTFRALWDKIKHKTRYAVTIDTERLVADVVNDLAGETIAPPRIVGALARVEVSDDGAGRAGAFQAMQLSAAKTLIDLAGHYPLPNLIDLMANQMAHTSPPVRLTRRTLLDIVRRAPPNCRQAVVDNPTGFAAVAVGHIKTRLADQLVDGIQYEKINQWYEMTQFQAEIESWQEYLVPAGHSIYDCVIADSGVERQFVQDLEQRDDVLLYIKLPAWFTVPTPIGQYNPDWAIVIQERDEFGQPTAACTYLVNETKSTKNLDELRPDERRKIVCGKEHFEGALGVVYKREPSAHAL